MKVLIWSARYGEYGDYRELGEFDSTEALNVVDIATSLGIEDSDGNLLTVLSSYYSVSP